MKITIYGAEGCATCSELKQKTQEVVDENGFDAEVDKVEDMKEVASRGLMSTPGFEIEDEMVFTGNSPPKDHLKELIEERS